MKNTDVLKELQKEVNDFGTKRNWQPFHSPKNISMALSVEASELVEIFQWKTEEQSKHLSEEELERTKFELADIFMYTLLACEKLNIDLEDATREKIQLNETRFPKP